MAIQILHGDGVASKIEAVFEMEVYAAGVRELNENPEEAHEFEAVPALRYAGDHNNKGAQRFEQE